MSAWREELDAITGSRHGGQIEHVLELLTKLDDRYPNVAEINYQLAWTCDVLGQEAKAVPYYEKAIALGLPSNELSGALLGLGSSLRCLGQLDRSVEVLRFALAQFPDNREFDVFLALSLHQSGQHRESTRLLLTVIADTSEDPGLTAYQRAIRHYAGQLDN
jgi:tetratricopeptide (TPR) repeat protein